MMDKIWNLDQDPAALFPQHYPFFNNENFMNFENMFLHTSFEHQSTV